MKRIKRNNRGFTMAELLIVVAIIAVLSSVAFIAVQNYSRGMAQLERDSIAKEIFVAAQNHLTLANSQGYPGVTDFGKAESANQNIFYYAINDSDPGFTTDGTSAIDQMLPFGAIEENVRARGTYIIRYQSNPATVLDVFYCPPTGHYPHELTIDDYGTAMGLKDQVADAGRVDNRGKRRNVSEWGGAVLGWYGGAEGLETGEEISAPDIRVENGDRLIVKVYNTNKALVSSLDAGSEEVSLKLVIQGTASGAQKAIALHYNPLDNKRYIQPRTLYAVNGEYKETSETGAQEVYEYTVVLDDITAKDMRFANLNAHPGDQAGTFIPGEDIVVSAVAYSNKKLTNIAYSREYTTNSLYGDLVTGETGGTATVSSIRHLENLDAAVSGVNAAGIHLSRAEQATDLDWEAFRANITDSYPYTPPAEALKPENVTVYHDYTDPENPKQTRPGCFKPVDVSYSLAYDGKSTLMEAPAEGGEGAPAVTTEVIHEIKNIRVDTDADAGVFGKVDAAGSIENLKIVDCDIVSTGDGKSAGALAGSLSGVAVKNVAACGKSSFTVAQEGATTETVTRNITSTKGDAGGLIGSMSGGSVENCAAALYVSGGANAGGLIGSGADGVQVKASYSGGHTDHGGYYVTEEKDGKVVLKQDSDGKPVPIVNVTGATSAGGLIGAAGDAKIENSYSTCSVKGQTAGGLAGTAGGEIKNCYATGLVTGAAGANMGAFAGKLTSEAAKVTGCSFYEIINDDLPALGTDSTAGIAIGALDADTASYDAFVGAPSAWNDAKVYDSTLVTLYNGAAAPGEPDAQGMLPGKFNLKTVDQLATDTKTAGDGVVHYGDWPAPEAFVANTKE